MENSICLFSFSCAYRFRQLTLSASRFACLRGSACQAHVRKRVSDRIIHTNSETALNARHLEVRFGRQLFFSVFPLIPLIRVAASSSRVDRQNVNPSVTSLRMSFVIANLDSRGRKRSGTRVRSSRSAAWRQSPRQLDAAGQPRDAGDSRQGCHETKIKHVFLLLARQH